MKRRTKKIISYILTLVVLLAAAAWIFSRFAHPGRVEFTDNAQVCMQIVPVNTRVQGYIKEIRFNEYTPVHRGDTLVVLDDADLALAVARARADLANAQAGRSVAGRSVEVATATDAATRASIEEARVLMENAERDYRRYAELLPQGAVTVQQHDVARTDYEAKKARYQTLVRQSTVASNAVAVSEQRINQNEAAIDLAAAQLRTAELNLSYTVILAPCDGYASRKEIQVGQLVQPGQTLLDVVDTGDVWVAANYKETQLQHIADGSAVEIKVDAIPGRTFAGTVESISRATGASLSLLPQDNSAGNFVKVRQRVPVRITFEASNDSTALALLRAGMNVECEVKY